MTALEIDDLEVRYGSGSGSASLVAVAGVSLAVGEGMTHGLVGESGSGKSTVARAIVGLQPASQGVIRVNGVPLAGNAGTWHRAVQMVFQNPYASLNPRMRVGEVIGEALQVHRPSLSDIGRRNETPRLLEQVGLGPGAAERYPHQFSGGQRQRIAIARALATEASVFILDEVTSALDVSVQANILNLLRAVQRQRRLAYLFISHDLAVVRYVSDVVSVMHLGRIVETAPTAQLFAVPRHPYTKALLDAVPSLGARPQARIRLDGEIPDPRSPPSGCRFHTRCPVGPLTSSNREICRQVDPEETVVGPNHRVACHFAGVGIA
jgi:peptide/nickel transport system ATP-binding protein